MRWASAILNSIGPETISGPLHLIRQGDEKDSDAPPTSGATQSLCNHDGTPL